MIITGYPNFDLMAKALQAGPLAVMKKPFTPDGIRVAIGCVAGSSETAMSGSR